MLVEIFIHYNGTQSSKSGDMRKWGLTDGSRMSRQVGGARTPQADAAWGKRESGGEKIMTRGSGWEYMGKMVVKEAHNNFH